MQRLATIKDSILDFAADVGVAGHELQKGCCEEESGSNEECLVELLEGKLFLVCEAFHDPQREVTGVDEEGKTHQPKDYVYFFICFRNLQAWPNLARLIQLLGLNRTVDLVSVFE